MTPEQAREIAEKYLAEANDRAARSGGTEVALVDIVEHRFGRSFTFQSARWVETRDSRYLLMGPGPVLIDRRDASVHPLGSADPHGAMARYEAQYDAEARGL